MSKSRYISSEFNKNCIINVAIGDFYVSCQKRLIRSAKSFCNVDILTWAEEYPFNCPSHKEKPYAFKPYAFMAASKLGYKNILWLDSVVDVVKPIDNIFNIISNDGYFFVRNGWSLGQWVKDEALDFFSIDRDKAMSYEDNGTGVVGINVESSIGYSFLEEWFCIAKNTYLFAGSKDNKDFSNSKDERCKGHRQEQSIASLLSMKMKMHRYPINDFLRYDYLSDAPLVIRKYL